MYTRILVLILGWIFVYELHTKVDFIPKRED